MRPIGTLGDAGFDVGATLKPDGHICQGCLHSKGIENS